jgi:carbonic anhydrase/acetyltransferase-like protein (isoleucine patch superfamily)
MASFGMLRRVALVRTDVSEEITRATRRNIPEDAIIHSHRHENLNLT